VPRPFPPVSAPPLAAQDGATFVRLVELMRRLLAPDGCPWDRDQSFASVRRYVLEEAAVVADAIDREDHDELRAELGDLLLQVVFLGELAAAEGRFGQDDIVAGIVAKLVRRHPHVFGDVDAPDAAAALGSWERVKAMERRESGDTRGLLGSIPRGLPALVRAQRLGEKAATVGFDWPDRGGPRAKIDEELAELDAACAEGGAVEKRRAEEELGDLLFAVVNLARHIGLDADAALGRASDRFARRFAHVEERVKAEHGGFEHGKLPLEVLDGYWDEAKEQR
jgi:tetrapyrrole methylase family protein/MazG family protein/ATP diphosphatase